MTSVGFSPRLSRQLTSRGASVMVNNRSHRGRGVAIVPPARAARGTPRKRASRGSSRCGLRVGRSFAGGVLALLAACGEGTPPPQPPVVTVETPVRRDVEQFGYFTGNTRALASAEIRARATGELQEMYFEPANLVKEGETLFLIEPDQYEALRNEAQASLDAARAEAARAESDLSRLELALQTNAVSESDVDRARALRDQAIASVASAEARLQRAQLDLDYTRVKTPIAGQVSRNLVDLGNLVSAQQATLLATVNQIDPIHVYFDAPEGVVLEFLNRAGERIVREGGPRGIDQDEEGEATPEGDVGRVEIATEQDEGYPHVGYLDYIDNTVDPATGTIHLRGVIPNEEFSLFPGLFVRVRVAAGVAADAMLIREVAVSRDLGGNFVLVVGDDNVVERRYVTLGEVQEDGFVVVEDGLEGSERYITNGLLRARPGLPVTPQGPEDAAPSSEDTLAQGPEDAAASPDDTLSQGPSGAGESPDSGQGG
ncbi:MAG: efflux RND transporter periplasmic adaptor subunit [Longimicrobiales bacterium]